MQILPNAYDHDLITKNADVLDGSYLFTTFAPFETKPQRTGHEALQEVDEEERREARRELAGRMDQRRRVRHRAQGRRPELHPAEGHRRARTSSRTTPPTGSSRRLNWTDRPPAQDVDVLSRSMKVVNGKFKPVFSKPGKPFLCFPRQSLKKLPDDAHRSAAAASGVDLADAAEREPVT